MEIEWLQVFSNCFWALFSAVAGFAIAVVVSEKRQKRKEEEQRAFFLQTVISTLKDNIGRGEEMRKYLKQGQIPTFSYDLLPISEMLFSMGHIYREDVDFPRWHADRKKMAHVNQDIATRRSEVSAGVGLLGQCQDQLAVTLSRLEERGCACVLPDHASEPSTNSKSD